MARTCSAGYLIEDGHPTESPLCCAIITATPSIALFATLKSKMQFSVERIKTAIPPEEDGLEIIGPVMFRLKSLAGPVELSCCKCSLAIADSLPYLSVDVKGKNHSLAKISFA